MVKINPFTGLPMRDTSVMTLEEFDAYKDECARKREALKKGKAKDNSFINATVQGMERMSKDKYHSSARPRYLHEF